MASVDVDFPLCEGEVARAVMAVQAAAREAGRPLPPVVAVNISPTGRGVTRDQFRVFVQLADEYRWRRGGARWALVLPADALTAFPDPLVAAPPAACQIQHRQYHGADDDDDDRWPPPRQRRVTINHAIVGLDRNPVTVQMPPVAGSPYVGDVVCKLPGHYFRRMDTGQYDSIAGGSGARLERVAQLLSGAEPEPGEDDTAALTIMGEHSLPGAWPVVGTGVALDVGTVRPDAPLRVCVTHEGIATESGRVLRFGTGVGAAVTIAAADGPVAQGEEGAEGRLVYHTFWHRVSVAFAPGAVVVPPVTTAAAPFYTVPVLSGAGTAGEAVAGLLVRVWQPGVAHLYSADDDPVFLGRLVLDAEGWLCPVVVVRQGASFLVVATVGGDGQRVRAVEAVFSAEEWLWRFAVRGPVSLGPAVHGVRSMCGLEDTGVLILLSGTSDAPRDRATPTLAEALRALLSGLPAGTGPAYIDLSSTGGFAHIVATAVNGVSTCDFVTVNTMLPGLLGLVRVLEATNACTSGLSRYGVRFFTDEAVYSRLIGQLLGHGGHKLVPADTFFYRGPGCVAHSSLPFPPLSLPTAAQPQPQPTPDLALHGYDAACSVTVLVRAGAPTQVVGFVLSGYEPNCHATGLTTETLEAFLLRCPGVGRVECMYVSNRQAEPDNLGGLPPLLDALIADGAGVIVDMGTKPCELVERAGDGDYVWRESMPGTNENWSALAAVVGCAPAVLPLLFRATS